MLEHQGARLNAPYFKRVRTGKPWVIAKWAMSLDGRIASASGDSRWISGEASRAVVHRLRGEVDAILVGRNTALRDNPLLTARPAGKRVATRVVFDSRLDLPQQSQLLQTAKEFPLLIVVDPNIDLGRRQSFENAGAELFSPSAHDPVDRVLEVLDELGAALRDQRIAGRGRRVAGNVFRWRSNRRGLRICRTADRWRFRRHCGGGRRRRGKNCRRRLDHGLGIQPRGDDICVHGLVRRGS